ncbi:MAG: hypothetical protein GXO60_08040 [Epsilonproteobacteria bacterium]|nr:hypothetical protein [Campylobacterota bacterium]
MIRVAYWLMALIELLILLGTILIFVLSDSRTIDILGRDVLAKYNINYENISGNIFTGIEVFGIEYNSTQLIDKINIQWNPIALLENKIHITKLELKELNPDTIIKLISSLPKSKKSKLDILFDYQVDNLDITAKPLSYHGIDFKNFELNIDKLSIDRDMKKIKSKLLKFSIDTDLVNIGLHGKIGNRKLHLNRVSLIDIDTKAITRFVKSFKGIKKNRNSSKKVSKKSYSIPLDSIKIDKLLASLKVITYGPITLEKTELSIANINIDPQKSYNINSKKAVLIAKTSFADTKQIGYIKNSKLYTKGNIINRDYLFEKYHLPLNRKGLRVLPAKMVVNHKGLWIEIDNSVKNLLVLKNDFNIDIKKATHKLSYIYKDKKIYICSKAKTTMTYSDSSDIENLVLIDIKKRGYTTYEGSVDIKKIKIIPKDISANLLENLKAKYKGDSKKLWVEVESNQIRGEFVTKGYKNAKLTIKTKKSQPISKLLKGIPKAFKNSLVDIDSNSFIDFKDNKKTKIGVNIHSDIANIYSTISIVKPFKIEFNTDIPPNSKISKIDKRINLNAISKLKGYVVLDRDNINHIFVNSSDLKIICDYNSKTNSLTKGVLKTVGEEIRFSGNLNRGVEIKAYIQNMNRLSKIVTKYYNIKLQEIKGMADIDMRLAQTSTISLKSKKISYGNLEGDLISKIYIDKNAKVDIDFKSKELRYIDKKSNSDPIKFHALSGKLSIIGNQIEIDRYSFKFYNDYISHFFSNKKSYLSFRGSTIYAKKVWLKDNILIKGSFNLDKMGGDFDILSNDFRYKDNDFDLVSRLNLNLEIDKKRLFLSGLVELLGNAIYYKVIGSGISEDSDIIILQEKSQNSSSILDNLKMNLQIKNQRAIRYKTDNIDIKFSNDITIIKDYNREFKLLGTTTIINGYYKQDDKKFFLDESYIYFSGSPQKPMLDIKAIYNKEQYRIQIFISGTPQDPIINFNSDPYLTQQQILSLILFDSTGENSGSGTELYALLGGTFAKELMKSLGISVDHLVLGQGIDEQLSVEVGQKISKNVTIIYLHNNGKDGVKVRVDHSRHFETDILLQPQSSSIEFLYKSD